MKRIFAIGLFLFLYSFSSLAQDEFPTRNHKLYSKQYLERTPHDSLNYYYQKARKHRKTGRIILLSGLATTAVGTFVAVGSDTEMGFYVGSPLAITGILTTIVGIPVLVIGAKREIKVKEVLMTHPRSSLYISPFLMYSNNSKTDIPGVSIKIRF